ncbi:hypothetical protein FHS57_004055 [Runella defluvii]|uniref:PQ-loop repeat-containing protein n=1 Tax=Runella defluvii TaxID=370973 RepID=A0A7W5ZR06_9BACT|nr:hypothetical protein [Runella defluvii]MBB3840042.1 hypothetical protein [Runella defluvii]
MNTSLVLAGISGICWTIVYIECIRLGFKQKTYSMPFWALALNIAWETLHTIIGYREEGLTLQVGFNAVWCFFDIGILYTYFKYGQKYFPDFLSKNVFIAWSVLGLIVSYFIQYYFVEEFGLVKGGSYSAFLQNLAMSILFIAMFVQRRGNEGQSLTLAINKFIGTLTPTILVGIVGLPAFGKPNLFILVLGICIAVFDIIYIGLLLGKQKES